MTGHGVAGRLATACVLSLVVTLAPSGAAAAPATSEWYQLGGYFGHNGHNPFEQRLTSANVGSLRPGWKQADARVRFPLVIRGAVQAVGDDRYLRTWGLRGGSLGVVARVPRCTDDAAPPVVTRQVLLVPTSDCDRPDSVQAYPVGGYRRLWQRDVPGGITSTTEQGGVLYVTGARGRVTALDVASGAVRWSVTSGTTSLDDAALAQGVLYVSGFRTVQARRLSDGGLLWQRSVGEYNALAAAGDRLYVGSLEEAGAVPEQRLFALSSTGNTLWQASLSRADVFADVRPAVANGLVLTTSVVGEVVALDAGTGRRRWTDETLSGRMSSVSIAGGVAYDIEDEVLRARRLTDGAPLFSTPVPGAQGAPVVAEGHVVVGGTTLRTFRLPRENA